jgi:undecaprenyl-diphosphatase
VDWIIWIWTILLGIIEGITEFLPVSSTAHLLLAERWMGLDLDEPFWKVFAIFIQIGAILAVVVYFRRRILDLLMGRRREEEQTSRPEPDRDPEENAAGPDYGGDGPAVAVAPARLTSVSRPDRRPLWIIALASAPVFIGGFLVYAWVEAYMANPLVIAASLAIGGLVMLLIEWLRPVPQTQLMEQITIRQAIIVGLAQLLSAVLPGTSRAAATIMGGMAAGLSRKAATEFSFFLAIPVMFAAGFYSLLRNRTTLTFEEGMLVAVGTFVSFLVSWVVIAGLMEYIRRYTFVPFAIYRILLAAAVLVWLASV